MKDEFSYFGFAIVFIPLGLFGLTMIAFPRSWREWSDRKYALSKKPIKIDALQPRSDGAWRALGVGMMLAAAFVGWYMARPMGSGQRQPLPSTHAAPQ